MLNPGWKQGEAVCVNCEEGSLMANVSDAAAPHPGGPGSHDASLLLCSHCMLGSKERSKVASFGLHNRPRPYVRNTH